MTKFPMTAAGYSALQDELNQRMAVERPRLIQRMQEAIADDSNLAENSEYHAAQAGQLMNEARIVELEDKLARAEVIDVSKLSGDTIKFGATVTLINADTDETKVWRIVGEPEANANSGKISVKFADRTSVNRKGQGRCRGGRGSNWCSDLPSSKGGMALMLSNDEQMRMMIGLQAHVQRLAGDIGERNVFHTAALNDAASYIESEWSRQGYAVSQLMYEVSGVRCANLEVVRDGKARRREILLIGAHYDSVVGSPGANDNGSGVAALLEISRRFVAIEPAMTVRFVAFVNEEPPFFMSKQQGSMVYAKSARHRSDDIRLMASLETIGWYSNRPGSQHYPPLFNLFYPDRADFIGFVCDFHSGAAMRRLAHAFKAHSDFPLQTAAIFRFVPGVSWSDHWSFWRQGYRAMMITDTAPYRYPHYHAAADTPDKLVYPEFAQATLGLCAAFIDVAQKGLD